MQKISILLMACIVALGGCATVNPMAINEKSTKIDTTNKSILLMSMDVLRTDHSRYSPEPLGVRFVRLNTQEKDIYQNFKLDRDDDTIEENGHTIYLVRMALTPGQYLLSDIVGRAKAFPVVGFFSIPLRMTINIQPGTVTYIGCVTATLRPRQGNEFRAGPVIPLIDQSVSGMSGGTWDVMIQDSYRTDIPEFRQTFPVLASATVIDAPLPAFDRKAVQQWWDGNQPATQQPVAQQPVANNP